MLSSAARSRFSRIWLLITIGYYLYNSFHRNYSKNPQIPLHTSKSRPNAAPSLPPEYLTSPTDSEECEDRYGPQYLHNAVSHQRSYCEPEKSRSRMSCFTSNIIPDRRDPFCISSQMKFPHGSEKFELDCHLRDWENSTDLQDVPQIEEFHKYWYDTGAGHIFNQFIDVRPSEKSFQNECNSTSSHTVLIKREGAFNLWHSLMEIFSYTLTMDALSLALDPSTNKSFFTPSDTETTQIVILDSSPPGPYFELWQLLAKKPIQRFHDLQISNPGTCLKNIIVPLAGSSNPLWQGDWIVHDCKYSKLLSAFVSRVLSHFSITPSRDPTSPLVATFINRTSRKLLSQEALLSNLTNLYPNIAFQSIDFATLSFRDQLAVIQNTDILVGVHGAGLTHAMFLPPRSAVVEILPEGLMHKGFANLAKTRELNYFSAHGESVEIIKDDGGDWHARDVYLEESRFLDIMDVAIKSVYHTRLLDMDAV